jgi:hypothetical protein
MCKFTGNQEFVQSFGGFQVGDLGHGKALHEEGEIQGHGRSARFRVITSGIVLWVMLPVITLLLR